jgi:hypothetical protein
MDKKRKWSRVCTRKSQQLRNTLACNWFWSIFDTSLHRQSFETKQIDWLCLETIPSLRKGHFRQQRYSGWNLLHMGCYHLSRLADKTNKRAMRIHWRNRRKQRLRQSIWNRLLSCWSMMTSEPSHPPSAIVPKATKKNVNELYVPFPLLVVTSVKLFDKELLSIVDLKCNIFRSDQLTKTYLWYTVDCS